MSNKVSFMLPKQLAKFKIKDQEITIPLPNWMSRLFLTLENDFNYLRNIVYSQLNLEDDDIPIGKTNIGEIHYPLIMLAESYPTASTGGESIGGYFRWDPSAFPAGNWYLEASIYNQNASAITTCTLTGSADIGSVTTQSTSLDRKRSDALAMPETAQNLWIKLKTNNASYAALIRSAKLIYIP